MLAKDYAAARLGKDWITPTLWCGTCLPSDAAWDYPYVVKARHGCGHNIVVQNATEHAIAVQLSSRWVYRTYGAWLDEWLYGEINAGLLVEPFIGEGRELPIDYKVFVFGGQARFIQVHIGRGRSDHRWIVFDTAWRRVSLPSTDLDPPPPASLIAMLRAAEQLGEGFSFVRADFYDVAGRARFGELTFYPGSGLEKVEPRRLDLLMGLLWSAALPSWLETAVDLAA